MNEISLKFKVFYFLFCCVLLTLPACENRIEEEKTNTFQLNKKSLDEFNRIFDDFSLNGKEYHFLSGYWIEKPKFDEKLVRPVDTTNMVLFALKNSDYDSIIIAANYNGCFASVVYKLEERLYINQSVIFPFDFAFLNNEQIPIKFNCINTDEFRIRETNYDAHMIGEWNLDSINSIRMNYKPEFEIYRLTIEREWVIINDSIKFKYFHSGYDFRIIDTDYYFFKVLTNDKFMILINVINDSYEEYYFSKKQAITP